MWRSGIISTLAANMLDGMGDLSPQLLRELRGRLKRFPVLAAVGLSLLIQLVVIVAFSVELPGSLGTIVDSDLSITTYPQLTWSSYYQLDTEVQDKIRNESAPRYYLSSLTRESGLFLKSVNRPEPVQGDNTIGLAALDHVQQGDRLIAIDGAPVTLSWDNSSSDTSLDKFQAHLEKIDRQILSVSPDATFSDFQSLIGTTVTLRLHRAIGDDEFAVKLPRIGTAIKSNEYCLTLGEVPGRCQLTSDNKAYQVDWTKWYRDLFRALTTLIVFALMGIGTFLLANDLVKEKQRGTLSLLRLSPRSAFTILAGKLVGVPICLYLAIALAVPFHWFAGLSAGYDAGDLLGFDAAFIGQTLVFYLIALFLSLATPQGILLALQPWIITVAITLLNWQVLELILSPICSSGCWSFPQDADHGPLLGAMLFSPFANVAYVAQKGTEHADKAFYVELATVRFNFGQYTLLTITHALGWCGLLYHLLQRRFSSSRITLLQRIYSYPLTAIFTAIVLLLTMPDTKGYDADLVVIACLGVLYCVALAIALTPNRQTLQDWTRFRHTQMSKSQQSPLWKELLISDNSSPAIAISLNVFLAAGLFTGWFLLCHSDVLNTRLAILNLERVLKAHI